jgi:hypothetical protein
MLWVLGLSGFISAAAADRIIKRGYWARWTDIMGAAGGGVLALSVILAPILFTGPWRAWPMMLWYILALSYAGISIWKAVKSPGMHLPFQGILLLVLAATLPLAGLVSQMIRHEATFGPLRGGLMHALTGYMKAGLICYGAAWLAASALAGLLASKYGVQRGEG